MKSLGWLRGLCVGLLAGLAVTGAEAGALLRGQSLESAALGRPLSFDLYLPDAAADPGAALPLVLLLHGYGAGAGQWSQGAGLPETLDAMIAAGEVAPFIAVMPDAGNSWYVDSAARGGAGDFETAIVRDLLAEIDRTYPTDPRRGARGIAGLSMGGHGALRLGFRHGGSFGAIAALSPAIMKPGGLSGASGPLGAGPETRHRWYGGMTGPAFEREVFDALSPFAELDALAATEPPPRILLTVGDDDYFGLYDGTLEMFLDLRALGLKPELRVSDGGHDWGHWGAMAPEVFRFFDRAFRAD